MSGGYTDCSCRDCFDVAIGEQGKALCGDCEDAGCEANDGECQRDDAYGIYCRECGSCDVGDSTCHEGLCRKCHDRIHPIRSEEVQ